MKKYQLTLVLRASLTDANRKKITESLKDFLKKVKIVKEEELGEKTLAYAIKKEKKGFYYNYQLETEEALGTDLDKKLTTNEDVLRHLLLRSN